MNTFIVILKILGMFALAYSIPATILFVVIREARKIETKQKRERNENII